MTAPESIPRKSWWHLAMFGGMMLLLCAPALTWALRIPDLEGVTEMRPLANRPEWKTTPLARWASGIEAWANDHFPSRLRVVQWNGLLHHRGLGKPSSLVVVGRDNWLFYVGEKTVPDLLGHDLLTEAELDAWCQAIEGRCAWWRQHGATYLFVITPNKSTIYPEKLSAFFQGQLKPGKFDQLIEHLRKRGCRAPLLDLRPILLQAKAQHTVYRLTDSHWNAEGLLAGSDAIMRRLQELGASFRPRDENTWFRSEPLLTGGDCIWLLSMSGRWPLEATTQLRLTLPPDARSVQTPLSALPAWKVFGDWNQPIAFERDSGVGTAVMLCDSFFRVGGLAPEMFAQPPLMLNFRRFVSLWPWASTANLATYEILADIAKIEKPTVVIEQWTERYLRTSPPDHPEFQRARAEVFSGSAP